MNSHQQVMQQLGCDELGELVDRNFLQDFGLVMPEQYGMVCQNVKEQIANLEELGAGPFVHATMKMPNWKEYGQPKEAYAEMALGYSNGQQIELLGEGKNINIYKEKIPADGSIALHHVCVFQEDIVELERRLNGAGFPTAGSGHIGISGLYTTCVRYIDTRETLGIYLEMVEYRLLGRHSPPGEKLITALAKLQKRFGKS
jgi:hypothetical protein